MHGLVALMEIQASRFGARTGPSGEPILLLDQNRARWDQLLIRRGLAALARAEARAGARAARALRAAGRDRRLPRAGAHRRRRPTGRASPALYGALAELTPSPGRGAQPRGGAGDGVRARRRASSSSTR